MTTKTIEDVRRYFAEEIMGYTWNPIPDFKPDKNLEQAFECLDKIEEREEVERVIIRYDLMKHAGYYCYIGVWTGETWGRSKQKTEGYWVDDGEDRIDAILRTILKYENQTELLEVLEDNG